MRLDRKEARRRITAVNKGLRDGHRPPGVEPSRKEPNAVTVAAERLGVSRQSFAQVLPSIARHYGLTPNWIIGLEYDYIGLQTKNYNVTGGAAGLYTFDVKPRVHELLARISYKF